MKTQKVFAMGSFFAIVLSALTAFSWVGASPHHEPRATIELQMADSPTPAPAQHWTMNARLKHTVQKIEGQEQSYAIGALYKIDRKIAAAQ